MLLWQPPAIPCASATAKLPTSSCTIWQVKRTVCCSPSFLYGCNVFTTEPGCQPQLDLQQDLRAISFVLIVQPFCCTLRYVHSSMVVSMLSSVLTDLTVCSCVVGCTKCALCTMWTNHSCTPSCRCLACTPISSMLNNMCLAPSMLTAFRGQLTLLLLYR